MLAAIILGMSKLKIFKKNSQTAHSDAACPTVPTKINPKKGRPSMYRPEYAEQAYKLCLMGATDARLAAVFEVSVVTLNDWKKKHPDFLKSLKEGKEIADGNVAESLYRRALGYSHIEDDIRVINGEIVITPTTKHYPPDTAAATLWLKNRQAQLWRDKVEHTGADGGAIQHAVKIEFV